MNSWPTVMGGDASAVRMPTGCSRKERNAGWMKDEVRKALKRMKSGKAFGPDDIQMEVWKCLGEVAISFLTRLFNRILESDKMPDE